MECRQPMVGVDLLMKGLNKQSVDERGAQKGRMDGNDRSIVIHETKKESCTFWSTVLYSLVRVLYSLV